MRWAGLLLAAVLMSGCASTQMDWAVYYGDTEPPDSFRGLKLVVLDADYSRSIEPLRRSGTTVLGYLSLGEAEEHREHFSRVSDLLVGESPNWPGSHYIDIRERRWRRMVLEELVPALLDRGFDGVFLDTLDTSIALEQEDPERFAGMTDAAARLVLSIRRRFPEARIMVNRAYALLPEIDGAIDYALGESSLTKYDFAAGRYRWVDPDDHRRQVEMLQAARRRQPELMVMTLDYWDPADTDTIAAIYRRQRANGFLPYVATVRLDRVVRPR